MLDHKNDIHPLFNGAPRSTEFKKLRKRLVQQTCEALTQYGMIEPGARWLVCLSGGKDSYTLLAVLHELKWRGLLPVDLLGCNLDQGQPGFPATVLTKISKDARGGTPYRIPRHLFHCNGQDTRRAHHVRAVLKVAPWQPVPHCP